jgi:alanine-glyoxylate transaminase/serine-glyoxylate transaminase/serine-pyruvate transaminase
MKGRKLLMIPGPIEFEPEVMRAMGAFTASHVAPNFIEIFGQAIERMREVWLSPSGQPFIIAGSGTLAMEMAIANLIEPGDRSLVLNIGYFGDRFVEILEKYESKVDQVCAPLGEPVPIDAVSEQFTEGDYKLMTITHVDTSTGVRSDAAALARLGQEAGVLVVLDGVCSLAGERLYMDDWGVDVALTASQKAVGVPPGLALLVASPQAMEAWRTRTTPVRNYFADFGKVLPIMEAYESRKPSYFGTPPVNLVHALNVSLGQILEEGMEARFARHERIREAMQQALSALELKQVPTKPEYAAATLTAPYCPEGIELKDLLPRVGQAGAIVAGGLHSEIKTRYFRIGHMGAATPGDVLATIAAVETGLSQCGYDLVPGSGLAAAQRIFQQEIK